MQTDYFSRYQGWKTRYLSRPGTIQFLQMINKVITYLMYCLYPLTLAYLYWTQATVKTLLLATIIPGLGFVLLSGVRRKINRPRPYQTYPIQPILNHSSSGKSFPSRHVFSATVIAMTSYLIHPLVAAFALLLAVILGLCRVLGGVHYPSDVVVSLACGLGLGIVLLICIQ